MKNIDKKFTLSKQEASRFKQAMRAPSIEDLEKEMDCVYLKLEKPADEVHGDLIIDLTIEPKGCFAFVHPSGVPYLAFFDLPKKMVKETTCFPFASKKRKK
jgi:hypothetical protein